MTRSDRRRAVVVSVAAVVVAVLVGGGVGVLVAAVRDDPSAPAATPTEAPAPSSSPTPRTTPTVNAPAGATDTGYLVSAARRDGSGKDGDVVELRFDRVQVLTGDAAERAAAADGQETQDGTYVVNDNRKLRTLLLRADATVTGDASFNDHEGDGEGPTRRSVDELIDFLRTQAGKDTLWDLRYDSDDVVTDVTERYTA